MESHEHHPVHHDSGSHAKHTLKLFNNPEANVKIKIIHNVAITSAEIFSVAIDPTEKHIACGNGDGSVKIIDLADPSMRGQGFMNIKTNSVMHEKYDETITSVKWKK